MWAYDVHGWRDCVFKRIAAGEQILVPIGSLNRDKAIWGEDADEFK